MIRIAMHLNIRMLAAIGKRESAATVSKRPLTVAGRGSVSGFTLLELLVSVTIVSLLATTVLFGWRIAAGAWQKANTHLRQSRMVLETNQLLQEQMSSMVPYSVMLPASGMHTFFQGGPQTARFLSRYSLLGRASSGLYRIEYQVVENSNQTKTLLMNESPVRAREDLTALVQENDPALVSNQLRFLPFQRGSQTLVLAEGLQDCRFEYYHPSVLNIPGFWNSEWPNLNMNEELPRAMAIRIATAAKSSDLQLTSIVAAVRNYSPIPYGDPRFR